VSLFRCLSQRISTDENQGLLGLMLGRLASTKCSFSSVATNLTQEMDATSCVREHKSVGSNIPETSISPGKHLWDAWWGKPWFSGDVLRKAVRDLIAQRISVSEREEIDAAVKDRGDAPLKTSRALHAKRSVAVGSVAFLKLPSQMADCFDDDA
jgi:hypothetical protein